MIACACGCTQRARHLDACADLECPGCLPRPAATGLAVCLRCEERARAALRGLPELWDDVTDAGALRARQTGARGRSRPIPLDVEGADWRMRLRVCLVGWCKVLEEDFSASLDDAQDSVRWMAHRVSVYAGRILASEHADQMCSDLLGSLDDEGRRHGDLWGEGRRLAYRGSGGQPLRVQCPCGERVKVETDPDVEMICPGCGEHGVLAWWRQWLVGDDPAPMTLKDVTLWLAFTHGLQVPERRLRLWADEGHITSVERIALPQGGGRGVRRFDPVAVAAVVLATGTRRTA